MKHLKILLLVCFAILWGTALLLTEHPKTQQDPKPPPEVISEEISIPASTQPQQLVAELNLAEVYQLIEKYYGFTPELINAIVCVESGWRPNTISETNDYGLMQVHYEYWDSYASQNIIPVILNDSDLLDPKTNLIVGATALYYWKNYSISHGDEDPYYFLNYYNAGFHPDSNNYETKVLGFVFE